jgi:ribose-phosphate pyrophosphokinase
LEIDGSESGVHVAMAHPNEPVIRQPGVAAVSVVNGDRLRLFALDASADLGRAVAQSLGRDLAANEERSFEDGEHKVRPLDDVGGTDVYVVQSLHGGPIESANDKLCRLLFFIGALKDAGAARVTAVVPYLCYARKDRRTKPSDPVTTRYVAELFEAVGTDCVVALDVHNPVAFENAFRCRTVALTATPLFAHYVRMLPDRELSVVSPDPGGSKRADLLREALEAALHRAIGKAFAEKRRSAGVVSGDLFVGEVAGTTALVVDDLISTGGTLLRAARAARRAGARRVLALVTHGLFMAGAAEALADPAIERLVLTDAVPAFRLGDDPVRAKIDVLPAAPLIAEAIGRLHHGASLTDLLVL